MITIDKFKIFNELINPSNKYFSILQNYIENYFDSELNVYHPDYIYQIIFQGKIDKSLINNAFDEILEKILIQKKQIIRDLIKKNKYSLSIQNSLITNLNNKIIILTSILDLKNKNNFINKILSDPILINYLESELSNTDEDSIAEIKLLNNSIKTISNSDNYVWFIKLLSSVLRNNIELINAPINEKYINLYNLNNIIEYINKIKTIYNFIDNINILINPLNEIMEQKLIICINDATLIELLDLMNYFSNIFMNIDKTLKPNIINAISNKLNINAFDNETYSNITNFLNLLIKCKHMNYLESYILLIFENKNLMENIQDIIHNEINNDLLFIKNIITLLSINNINIDNFVIKYQNMLIERLLSGKTNIINEITIARELGIKFGIRITSKINKIIEDYKLSIENNNIFMKTFNIDNFNTITTSYSNWDINFNKGYYMLDQNDNYENIELFSNYIQKYNDFYKKIYNNNRNLLWLLHYGEIEIVFNEQKIILLPIQLMILELFNIKEKISINEVTQQHFLNNYSYDYKISIINSLINGNILKVRIDNSTQFLELHYGKIKENLINEININNILIKEKYNYAFSNEERIIPLINHHVKINPKSKDELYKIIIDELKHFNITEDIIDKSIDIMIKKDYIIINDDKLIKCIY
jgi:hypothetical protein